MKKQLLYALVFWSTALAVSASSAQVPAAAPQKESPLVAGAPVPEDMAAKRKAARREAHRRIRIVHRHRIK